MFFFSPVLTHFDDEKMKSVTLNVRTFKYGKGQKARAKAKEFDYYYFLILISFASEFFCVKKPNVATAIVHTLTHRRTIYAQIYLLYFI